MNLAVNLLLMVTFVSCKGLACMVLGVFFHPDALVMGIHLSIKLEVGFVCPKNVTWLGINCHSREKL